MRFFRRPTRLRTKLAVTALFAVMILLMAIFVVPCPIRYLTGVMCPGCGMSRAWFMFIFDGVDSAFRFHRMFWSVPILYVYALFDFRIFPKSADRIILGAIALGFFANWMLNLV